MKHLVIESDDASLSLKNGHITFNGRRLAIYTLASVQCFGRHALWTQAVLQALAGACPVILARWDKTGDKWNTCGLSAKARHVHPLALEKLCRLSETASTHLASQLLHTKIANQLTLLRALNPELPDRPPIQASSLSRVLRLEASYARKFWAQFFTATGHSLLYREKRKPTKPINIALSYGYGYLYHAIEWNCLSHGLDCGVGLIHKHRKNRPNLACDLIEPMRCAVELTVIRHLDEIGDKARMASRFAEMMEQKFLYRGAAFRLRSIIRLTTQSFVNHLLSRSEYHPFRLHARDACL